MSRGIARKIGSVLIILVVMSVSGAYLWLQVGPEHNARLWLDKTRVSPGEPLTLNIRNLGSKSLEIGTPYIIFREYENGAIEEFNFSSVWGNWAWAASLLCLSPFGTYSQNILTDLEPGEYFVVKEYTAEGSVKYTKDLYFTVE